MGCIGSHLAQLASGSGHVHRSRPSVFSVLNVDDMGRHLQPGKLEVKETDLVLYVNGKLAMTWPLRCLRRYGFDEDLFSFESGRRCPSGPGIYAFKCNRAQSLFNLLQAKIQGNPTSLPPVPSTPITPSGVNPGGLSPTFDYVNISENQNMRGTASTTYQDGNVVVHSSGSVINTSTSIPQTSPDNNHPLYMNVENQNPPSSKNSNGTQSQSYQNGPGTRFNYSCNGTSFFADYPGSSSNPSGAVSITNTNNSVYYTNVDCSLMSTTTQTATSSATFINNGNASAEVAYAELDLEDSKVTTTNSTTIAFNSVTKVSNPKKLRLSNLGGSMGDEKFRSKVKSQFSSQDDSMFSSGEPSIYNASVGGGAVGPVAGTEGAPGDGYATIDFQRTAALSTSVVTRTKIKLDCNEENEVAVRKAHHNSIAL